MEKRAAQQKLYGSERWRKRATHQLRCEPWCRLCLAAGEVTAAQVADHVHPHRGDANQFWCGELQSLCKSCHDGRKRFAENRGFDSAVGADGMPLDPRHPIYTGALTGEAERTARRPGRQLDPQTLNPYAAGACINPRRAARTA